MTNSLNMTRVTEMNDFDYDLLTGQWEGPKGAAYNVVYEDCKSMGFIKEKMDGWTLTEKGKQAVAYYEAKNGLKNDRIDVV